MNFEVIVTCAVTGAGETVDKSPHVPVTPKEVADAAIEAAKAGASAAHVHVRDPETGKGSRDVNLFKEAVDRIRDNKTDVAMHDSRFDQRRLWINPPVRYAYKHVLQ